MVGRYRYLLSTRYRQTDTKNGIGIGVRLLKKYRQNTRYRQFFFKNEELLNLYNA